MKLIVFMWIIQMGTMDAKKMPFNGSIDACLESAIKYNKEHKDAVAGCYVDLVPSPKAY